VNIRDYIIEKSIGYGASDAAIAALSRILDDGLLATVNVYRPWEDGDRTIEALLAPTQYGETSFSVEIESPQGGGVRSGEHEGISEAILDAVGKYEAVPE